MTAPGASTRVYEGIVDRLVAAAAADGRLRALWLEGDHMAELRRPYPRLEVHLAADEPDFAAVLSGLEALLAELGNLEDPRWSEAPRFARRLEARLSGAAFSVVLEKTSLLAKRGRSAVLSMVDKTGRLTQVMDFSRPRPAD